MYMRVLEQRALSLQSKQARVQTKGPSTAITGPQSIKQRGRRAEFKPST